MPTITTRPVTIAIRLMMTWRTVNAPRLKPSIMANLPPEYPATIDERCGEIVVAARVPALKRRLQRIGQEPVQRRHHLRALADRPSDTLDGTGPDVADREHAGNRGFQRRDHAAGILLGLRAG